MSTLVNKPQRLMVHTELKVARRFAKRITVFLTFIIILTISGLIGDYASTLMQSRWVIPASDQHILTIERYPLAHWSSLLFVYCAPMLTASSIALSYITHETRRKGGDGGRSFRMFMMVLVTVLASLIAFFGSMVAVVLWQTIYP